MNRREFLEKSSCAMPCALAVPTVISQTSQSQPGQSQTAEPQTTQVQTPRPKPPNYKIEIEIFETRPDTWCHKKGDKFEWPRDTGKICPWLMGSMHDFIIILRTGGTLSWKYEGTPYQKVIDPENVTTEFVRCPDPTANLVAKIIRTKLA